LLASDHNFWPRQPASANYVSGRKKKALADVNPISSP
jgi:hypothetical protein